MKMTIKKLWKKVYGGTTRKVKRGKWVPWTSNIGAGLVRARLDGRWSDKGAA